MKAMHREIERLRSEYVQSLDELMELADLARRGLVAAMRDENVCVPIRATFDLGIKSYAAYDKWRLYRRARGKDQRRQRRRRTKQRQLVMV